MIVEVPLQLWALPGEVSVTDPHETLAAFYDGQRLFRLRLTRRSRRRRS